MNPHWAQCLHIRTIFRDRRDPWWWQRAERSQSTQCGGSCLRTSEACIFAINFSALRILFFLPQSLHSYIELKEREWSTRVPSISQHITLAAGFWTKRPAALQSVFQPLTLPSIWKYWMEEACQWAVHNAQDTSTRKPKACAINKTVCMFKCHLRSHTVQIQSQPCWEMKALVLVGVRKVNFLLYLHLLYPAVFVHFRASPWCCCVT